MPLFKLREGDTAIVSAGGVYKQVDVYERNGTLYAAASGGFVRLMYDGSTSKAKLRLETLDIEDDLFRGPTGHLGVERKGGWKPLESNKKQLLLAAK